MLSGCHNYCGLTRVDGRPYEVAERFQKERISLIKLDEVLGLPISLQALLGAPRAAAYLIENSVALVNF